MGDINRIDWQNHDGVNLSMINDFMRNQFYDNILRDGLTQKSCIDIGFGTGLLSIMALKHGAKHITAFESDPNRYELGKIIIDRLGLGSSIDLVNQRYDHDTAKADVIFSETVNGNLWQEGLWRSLPRSVGQTFLPGRYWLEISLIPCPERFARRIGIECQNTKNFDSGVDLDENFIDLINELMQSNTRSQPLQFLSPGINNFPHQIETAWGWMPYMRPAMENGMVLARYELDAERACITTQDQTIGIDWSDRSIKIAVDIICNDTCLLVPRVGMSHGNHVLTLDTGHWGPCQMPVILHQCHGRLSVDHNVYTGNITYQLES